MVAKQTGGEKEVLFRVLCPPPSSAGTGRGVKPAACLVGKEGARESGQAAGSPHAAVRRRDHHPERVSVLLTFGNGSCERRYTAVPAVLSVEAPCAQVGHAGRAFPLGVHMAYGKFVETLRSWDAMGTYFYKRHHATVRALCIYLLLVVVIAPCC